MSILLFHALGPFSHVFLPHSMGCSIYSSPLRCSFKNSKFYIYLKKVFKHIINLIVLNFPSLSLFPPFSKNSQFHPIEKLYNFTILALSLYSSTSLFTNLSPFYSLLGSILEIQVTTNLDSRFGDT